MTTEAFAPWIQPLYNNGLMLSPWIISDDDIASELVAQWLNAVECLFVTFTGWFPGLTADTCSIIDNMMYASSQLNRLWHMTLHHVLFF